jgi:putative ABC transport system permease protein
MRNPSYAFAAIAVVVLGVGASTAVFSVVRGVLLDELPYPDVERLVVFRASGESVHDEPALTAEEFRAIRERADLFDVTATANSSPASLTGVDGMERVVSASISDDFLPLFGVAPAAGRQVTSRDDVGPTWIRAVDISYELWQRRYYGDVSLIGRNIEVNNLPMTVVGVMPRGFRLYLGEGTGVAPQIDVWFPGAPDVGTARSCPVVARLRRGVALPAAQAAIDTFMKQFIAAHPASYRAGDVRLTLTPLTRDVVRRVQPALFAFSAAVGFVLLVACANLTNLLLARASARTRELAVRAALGASRVQVVRLLIAESVVIAALGALGGILMAEWARDGLLSLAPASLPRRENIVLGRAVLAFAASTALVSSVVCGLIPAWHATQSDVVAMLKQDRSGSASARRTRALLVASQLAVSLVLLVGAGLFARTFLNMRRVPLGFDPSHLVTMRIDLPPMRFTAVEQREAFYAAAGAASSEVPGVDAVAFGFPIPLSGRTYPQRFSLGPGEQERVAPAIVALPGYAELLGVPLRAGRYFQREDEVHGPVAALMLDERLAAQIFGGRSAVGTRLLLSPSSRTPIWGEVVGVVGHMQVDDLRHDARPQLWVSFPAMPWNMDLAFRTRRDPLAVAASVKKAVEALGPGRPLYAVRTLDDYVVDASADARFALFVLGVFAAVALMLTAIGVYGAVAYATARRSREIAVRLALGADARRIVGLVVRESAAWSVAGLVVGAIGARVLTRYIQTLLYNVSPTDALTYAVVFALLCAVACAATVVPAMSVVRHDPMRALRSDSTT